ncbi:MAG: DASS family sodium-coupled anion symporter [Negativicutes bacterium]
MNKTLVKGLVCLAVPAVILAFPAPQGLSITAWRLFAFYLGAIVGLILRPMPEPVILLTALCGISLFFGQTSAALSGYGNATTWLVFSAFMVGQCFIETGLGRRIAYLLIRYMGQTSLRLGYAAAITDLVISPATPSNTARTGGLVFPIFQSVCVTLDSQPGESAKRIGHYMMLALFQISLVTSTLFITANAVHGLTVSFAKSILHIDITWMQWATAMLPPGLILLLIIPWLVYKMYPPIVKDIDNKAISEKGLQELGPMTLKEKILAVLFVLATLGWATGSITKIDSTAIAVSFMTLCLVTGVVKWSSMLKSGGAWSTFIWYGGILSFAGALGKEKFFDWMGKMIGATINFADMNQTAVFIGILVISVAVRYFFASSAAYVSSFIPVLMAIGVVAKLPPLMLALMLAVSSMMGSLLTHYGNGVAPVLFGAGYVSQGVWWKTGHIMCIIGISVYLIVGLPLWKVMGIW